MSSYLNSASSLVVYELNEVPPRVIYDYCNLKPNSTIAKLLKINNLIATESPDKGELHPWTTWPTLHRGVPSSIHNIRSLNQDLSSSANYPPIWEVLISNKLNVGIFGSLHSYPFPGDSPYISFYVPDTFAPEPLCSSPRLTALQRFNLMMSSSNKAYSRRINLREVLFFLQLLVKFQLPFSLFSLATKQILLEVLNSQFKARRPFLQPILFFDKFISELSFHKPRYASFFTNHVAGVMHRFWHYTYPADFPRNFPNSLIKKRHIIKAMDIVDRQLCSLTKFCQKNNYDLWVLSSMGQEPLADYIELSELVLEEPSKLLSFLAF